MFIKLIQGVLINGMCLFGAWRRRAPTASSAKLDEKYKRANECCSFRWRTSDITRGRYFSMRVPSVSPCGAVPWVPSNEVQRGNGIWARRVKRHIR